MSDKGFFNESNKKLIIPLAGISIPILAILLTFDPVWLPWLIIGLAMTAAVTAAVKSVVRYSHTLRMEEIAAKERVLQAEHDQLRSAERILELDDTRVLRRDLEPPIES